MLTETELIPNTKDIRSKHLHQDLTSFNTNYLEIIIFDDNFIVEHSETSDSRSYLTSNAISDPSFKEYDKDTLRLNQDDNTDIFQNTTRIQNPEPQELITIHHQQQDLNIQQNLTDLSDTATLQNTSELSYVPLKNHKVLLFLMMEMFYKSLYIT